MKRKCNLELRLQRPSVFLRPTHHDARHPDVADKDEQAGEERQLTIFYNGKIVVCDATELQARTIIWLAGREGESFESGRSDLASPLYSPSNGLKRSLMRFLHARKARVQPTSPYSIAKISN